MQHFQKCAHNFTSKSPISLIISPLESLPSPLQEHAQYHSKMWCFVSARRGILKGSNFAGKCNNCHSWSQRKVETQPWHGGNAPMSGRWLNEICNNFTNLADAGQAHQELEQLRMKDSQLNKCIVMFQELGTCATQSRLTRLGQKVQTMFYSLLQLR